jgi:hypothetical protein
MEYKTMTQAELVESITSGELDAVELNEAVGALKKITSKGIEDGKAERVANVGLDGDDIQGGIYGVVSGLRERHGKVKFSGYIDFDLGAGRVVEFAYGSKRGGPVSPSSYKGCTFRIDEQDSVIFSEANGSHLNYGELTDGDVYPLTSAKRVWIYFGGTVRSDATKAEATATGKLAELTDEQRARVEVMKSGEAIALDDFLASLE